MSPKLITKPKTHYIILMVAFLVPIIVIFGARMFLFDIYNIPSSSMAPTLPVGTRIVVTTLNPTDNITRGDIIVFEDKNGWISAREPLTLVKRVIGLPGDTVYSESGKLYVNNVLVEEIYTSGVTSSFEPVTVPADSYFVLGDNRSNSQDSRAQISAGNPFVYKNAVVGELWFKI